MPTRKTLLHAMLWSLAFAAAAGVTSVLFSLGDLVGRLVGTGLISAAGCGLLILLSAVAERERARAAALAGMAAVIGEFVLAMLLIWKVPSALFGLHIEEELAFTMVNATWFGAVFMLVLRLRATTPARVGATVGLYCAPVAFAICLAAVWSNNYRLEDDLYSTGGALLVGGGLVMLALIGPVRALRVWWRLAGIASAAIVLAMWLWSVWIGRGEPLGEVIFAMFLTAGCLVGHASLALLTPLTPRQRWLLVGTIASAIATGVAIDVLVVNEVLLLRRQNEFIVQLAAAGGILASCGSLALCVLARMNRRMKTASDAPDLGELAATCPRCQRKQTLHAGRNACAACGLIIEVRLEEPRCAGCGYVLYGAEVRRCPECGADAKL